MLCPRGHCLACFMGTVPFRRDNSRSRWQGHFLARTAAMLTLSRLDLRTLLCCHKATGSAGICKYRLPPTGVRSPVQVLNGLFFPEASCWTNVSINTSAMKSFKWRPDWWLPEVAMGGRDVATRGQPRGPHDGGSVPCLWRCRHPGCDVMPQDCKMSQLGER